MLVTSRPAHIASPIRTGLQKTLRCKPQFETHQRWLKVFLDFALESAAGAPIKHWIETAYTPEALKAWLDARGMHQFYAAIFSVPTRSPFQW